jgi:lysozyme
METVEEMLIRHEGIRYTPYLCSAGRWTIGVGRNLDNKGLTKEEVLYLFRNDTVGCKRDLTIMEVMYLLYNDIDECEHDLSNRIFQGQFYEFPITIQHSLLDMRFQLGWNGFRGFRKMIAAFKVKDYYEAIVQMKDSRYYEQVTTRADELIKMVRGEA